MPSCFSWFSWTPSSTGLCTSFWANSPSWTWCWFPQLCSKLLLTTWLPGILSPLLVVGCGSWIFFFLTLGGVEGFLLAAMSYDCYVAIFHSLRFLVLMSWQLCLVVILGSWFLGAPDGLMQAAATFTLYYSSHDIDHFFCVALSLVHLTCANSSLVEFVLHICCVLMLLVPIFLIPISYSLILTIILLLYYIEAHKRAFATCSSHLSVVWLSIGAAILLIWDPDPKDQQTMIRLCQHSILSSPQSWTTSSTVWGTVRSREH